MLQENVLPWGVGMRKLGDDYILYKCAPGKRNFALLDKCRPDSRFATQDDTTDGKKYQFSEILND